MLLQIKGNIKSDILILFKSDFMKGSLLVASAFVAYVLYTSSNFVNNMSQPGYYTAQMLILLTQFNIFVIIICGAYFGSKDFDWQTYSYRLVNSNRSILLVSRLSTLLGLSILGILFHFAVGTAFDLLGGTIESLSVTIPLLILLVIIIVWLWGVVSYLIAFLTKSFSIASSIGIGYLFFEGLIGRFLPNYILKFLPLWNQKTLLKHFFSTNEGALAIVQQEYGNYLTSLYILLIYLVISLIALFALCKYEQY